MHTKDILANELERIGLTEMAAQARTGFYHDFLSPLPMPELQLCDDLMAATLIKPNKDEILDLRERVINGDFDASIEESEAWAESQEGQDTFSNLIKGR